MALKDFFDIAVCAELTALTAALLTVVSKAAAYWRLFIVFLFITIVIEAVGFYMTTVLGKKDNSIVYNAFMLLQMLFYCLLFFKFAESKRNKLLILTSLGLFVVFFMYEGITKSTTTLFTIYQKSSRLFVSVYVVFFSCSFFLSVLKTDTIKNPLRFPPFWIVTGLFFYYFGSIVLFAFRDYITRLRISGNSLIYELITGSLSIILYGSWIIGFIWKKKSFRQ